MPQRSPAKERKKANTTTDPGNCESAGSPTVTVHSTFLWCARFFFCFFLSGHVPLAQGGYLSRGQRMAWLFFVYVASLCRPCAAHTRWVSAPFPNHLPCGMRCYLRRRRTRGRRDACSMIKQETACKAITDKASCEASKDCMTEGAWNATQIGGQMQGARGI